ncbi:MAG: recombinase family protein [Terriglobia bacterium]
MNHKVTQNHLQKPAFIYVRQSTMGQVRYHQESTERQYALKHRAEEMGWLPHQIRVLDGDLGMSGARTDGREDFKSLVAEVSMQNVGAVFAIEVSRLARSCADWHRLLELCAYTGTLIIDEDGCYNPAEFNDQLLLGLKGTMSQAELHFIKARLYGGKLNKAKKGLLRFPLPVGFCFDEQDKIILDPDEEVRGAVSMIFSAFRETGSAYGVVHKFVKLGLRFPKRSYGGVWQGKLVWGGLTHARVLGVLKNPSYAGVYAFGRYHYAKEISSEGRIISRPKVRPMQDWQVKIDAHHESYVSWDEYLKNQSLLQSNRTNGEPMILTGAAREGLALLQGLLLCGTCGRRLHPRYTGNGGIYPTYQCNWRRREGLSTTSCMSARCADIDAVVVQRIFELLRADQLQIAIHALTEIEKRDAAGSKQWQMKLDRAEYETQLAQKRYEEVDPANRLVAATLERRWNEALAKLEELKQSAARVQQDAALSITAEQKSQIMSLAKDLPKLWKASTTQPQDRKRILRLLLKDITVEKLARKSLILHIRWQGGATDDVPVELPPDQPDVVRYPDEFVERIRDLATKHSDPEIVAILNTEGQLSSTGKQFTASMISWIRFKHKIPSPSPNANELTVAEVATKFGVSHHVVYYWIERNFLAVRRIGENGPFCIQLDQHTEEQLHDYVDNSPKLRRRTSRSQMDSTGGPPKAGEFTVAQLAAKFRVSHHVIYYWIEIGHLHARRTRPGGPLCAMLDDQTEDKLRKWVHNSSRLQKNFSKSSRKNSVGGAK